MTTIVRIFQQICVEEKRMSVIDPPLCQWICSGITDPFTKIECTNFCLGVQNCPITPAIIYNTTVVNKDITQPIFQDALDQARTLGNQVITDTTTLAGQVIHRNITYGLIGVFLAVVIILLILTFIGFISPLTFICLAIIIAVVFALTVLVYIFDTKNRTTTGATQIKNEVVSGVTNIKNEVVSKLHADETQIFAAFEGQYAIGIAAYKEECAGMGPTGPTGPTGQTGQIGPTGPTGPSG